MNLERCEGDSYWKLSLWCSTVRAVNFFHIYFLSGVRLSPIDTATTTGLLYQPQMTDDDECGTIGVMRISRRNQSTWRKPAPIPLRLPQIPHDLTRART
jgi:hypothetical protein